MGGQLCPLGTLTVRRPIPMELLNYPLDAFRTYAGSFTWQRLVRFSRNTVLNLLRRIATGQIVVRDSDGAVTICGAPQAKDGTPRSELRVLKETFWVRVLLFADMVSIVPSVLVGGAAAAAAAAASSKKPTLP